MAAGCPVNKVAVPRGLLMKSGQLVGPIRMIHAITQDTILLLPETKASPGPSRNFFTTWKFRPRIERKCWRLLGSCASSGLRHWLPPQDFSTELITVRTATVL